MSSSIASSSTVSNSTIPTTPSTHKAEGKSVWVHLTGSCSCRNLTYKLSLESMNDARASLCHCGGCKKAFGGAFGLMVKVPLQAFLYARESGLPTTYVGDNGSGMNVYREFCSKCGSYICEYAEGAKDHFRYIMVGSLDNPSVLPPKAEFFCSQREEWMPEIPGKVQFLKT